MLRCTIFCRCFGFEVVRLCKVVRFVAVAFVSRWCPNAKKTFCCCFDLSGVPMLRCDAPMSRSGIRCRCLWLEVMPQCFDSRFVDFALVWKRCPSAKMCDLFLLLWSRNGAPMLKCAIRCRCFGFEKPQCEEVSKWCPNAKISELPVLRHYEMQQLLPLLWLRSFASVPSRTVCCRCLDLEVVPQSQGARFIAVGLVSNRCRNVKTWVFFVVALFSKWYPSDKMYDVNIFLISKWS